MEYVIDNKCYLAHEGIAHRASGVHTGNLATNHPVVFYDTEQEMIDGAAALGVTIPEPDEGVVT